MASLSPTLADPSQSDAYSTAFQRLNPLDRLRIEIANELSEISGADSSLIFNSLDRSTSLNKGDLILAIPRLGIKGSKPAELAQKWLSKDALAGAPAAEGFFLTFSFNSKELPSILLPNILQQGEEYGYNPAHGLRDKSNPDAGKKTIIVEFSSPNIAKKFHAGHLRSTIIGGFLSNLYEKSGYKVIRMNYLGDWGRQYGLLACAWKRYGDESAFIQDPISHLFDIYVKISADFKPEEDAYKAARKCGEDTSALESTGLLGEAKAYFKRMEDGDEEALQLWSRFRQLSIKRYEETYARLNIHFDVYSGESHVKKESMDKAEEVLKERQIIEFKNDAWLVDFNKHGAKGLYIAITRNRNGTSNYLLRDIGEAMQRDEEYHFDEMLYVVMSEQETHLKRLFKILGLMGDPFDSMSKKMKHITYGRVIGMSTRKGTVKFLDDVVDDVADFMHRVMRRNEQKYAMVDNPVKTAEILGISAIMVQDMSGKRINDYEFDDEKMTSFEGDTGPYLQYAHARLCSIFQKLDFSVKEMRNANFPLLSDSPHAIDLLRVLAQFPDIVNQALKNLEPATILTYLFKLTHKLSSSYGHLKVVDPIEGPQMSLARAALYYSARQVLRNGAVLLGITLIDRM